MAVDGPASTAQCFYCFEVLSAHFEGREPAELAKVIELYEEYKSKDKLAKDPNHAGTTPLQLSPDRSQDDSPASGGSSSSLSADQTRSSSRSPASLASPSSKESVTAPYPVYVTWNTVYGRSKALRGCIGTFEPLPLQQGLRTYSLVSALEDYRFSPIPASLIPSLGCELTLLSDFEDCNDAMDWEIGRHGLKINFTHRGRRMGATYLPHVCPEQGWNKEECVESLMQKAGWEHPGAKSAGGVRRWLPGGGGKGADDGAGEREAKPWETVSDMKVVRYQGAHAAADYAEWRQWREWAKGRI